MKLVDIHNHALFGVDDGALTIKDSILMLNEAIENKISDIILTPHLNKRSNEKDVLKNFEALKAAAKDLNINLYLGREVRYYQYKQIDYKTLNESKYCLVEFSMHGEDAVEEVCFNLKTKGLKPIVAHIERYHYLKKEDYFKIKESAQIQINAESVLNLGSYKKDYKIAMFLLKNRLVDYVASDAHNTELRGNKMLKAYNVVKKRFGTSYANLIFKENAQAIIMNK